MSTTNPPEETAAADDAADPVPLSPPTTLSDHRRPRSSGSLIGADLAMVLTIASVIGLLLGVVGLVELLTRANQTASSLRMSCRRCMCRSGCGLGIKTRPWVRRCRG